MRAVHCLCGLSLLTPGVAPAMPAVTDPAFLQAAVVLGAFDRLASACAATGGFVPGQQDIIDDWRATQRVDLIRARLKQLAAHPTQEAQVTQAADLIVTQLGAQGLAPCPAATSVARLPQAEFTRSAAAFVVTDAPAPAAVPAIAPPAPPNALAAIDSIGFHTRAKMGVGDFVTLDVFPVLMLRSGELVKDVAALREPGGLDAHRAAHPAAWTRWRRQGGSLELLTTEGWKPLAYQTSYAALPANLVLDGGFRALGGTGNVALGGSDSVAVWDAYRFAPDGRVERSGGAGASAAFGDAGVTTRSTAAGRRGRYRIDGLTLVIDYDDGAREQRVLVIDPRAPDKALWLDGTAYVRRD